MSFRGGSRRQGSRSHPHAVFIRFTEKEQKDLAKLLRKRGMTMQAFGHAAIIRALNEANLGKKAEGEIERDSEPQRPVLVGLGIRDRLRESVDEDDYGERRSESTPSIGAMASAPVLTQARTIDDTILALARTVVAAPQSHRRDALKNACSALTRGRTLEEAVRLADDLDAAIQRVGGAPQSVLERVRARAGR